MNIVDNIKNKIDQLKKDDEKMSVGIQFETQFNEKMNELDLLEQEINKVLQHKD